MPRKVTADDLVGAAEIADRLGVAIQTVYSWRRRHDDFPEPVAKLSQVLIWTWSDVEAWVKRTGRQ